MTTPRHHDTRASTELNTSLIRRNPDDGERQKDIQIRSRSDTHDV